MGLDELGPLAGLQPGERGPIGRVQRPVLRGRVLAAAVAAGVCDSMANLFFVLATRYGLLSLASVLTALYPAFTVLLAVTLLHERTSRVQQAGLALAAVSVVLVTV